MIQERTSIQLYGNIVSGVGYEPFHKINISTVKELVDLLKKHDANEIVQLTYRPDEAKERTKGDRTWTSYGVRLNFYTPKEA